METQLGTYQDAVVAALATISQQNIVQRIWDKDYTVWANSPDEITNRLGWLRIMDTMQENLEKIQQLVTEVKQEGYTNVLLLGMGGSSLAPDVFSLVYGAESDGLHLEILDSTDPGAVLTYDETLDSSKTLYIVATKSGGTAETLSAFKYFYNQALADFGDDAGKHFVAITDPNSKLQTMAEKFNFRATFLNDPNIGGRYSVLSYFGMLPAALIGIDIATLLQRAQQMATNCHQDEHNQGAYLGAVMGELAQAGRDKVTLIISPALAPFGDWVEQLVAESTGKNGKGILPIVGETVASPDVYGNDRLFVHLRLDDTYDAAVQALQDAGQPVVTIDLNDKYDMGGQFFLWEMATAVASYIMGVQPFDQPNVESAKVIARRMIAEYQDKGELPTLSVNFSADGVDVFGDVDANSPAGAIEKLLEQAVDGSYISIHAYVQPNAETSVLLSELQNKLRAKTKLAVTIGYGPRFLHSTGQLHKGDAGKGLFIQFTAAMPRDVAIPDEAGAEASSMSFGTLRDAQALGDRQALLDANRPVLRLHFEQQIAGLKSLVDAL